jgi:hypothetical protein
LFSQVIILIAKFSSNLQWGLLHKSNLQGWKWAQKQYGGLIYEIGEKISQ